MEASLLTATMNFVNKFYGRYVIMFILFLLAMRVTVVMVNVLTGKGLHLGGYLGYAERSTVRKQEQWSAYTDTFKPKKKK